MANYVDLEIGIRRDGDDYAVELRCSHPESNIDVRSGSSLVQFNPTELLKRSIDDASYGKYLTKQLWDNLRSNQDQPSQKTGQSPWEIFVQARGIAQFNKIPLRLQLFIGPNAPELHNLCWEKLCDPLQDWTDLLTNQNVLFSRYLSSLDWSPLRLRRETDLSVLVVVANPDLSKYPSLAQVDVKGELSQAESSLKNISVTALASEKTTTLVPEGKATLENMLAYLSDGYDILYLICHGSLEKDEPILWLENEAGGVDRVSGNRLVARIRKLSLLPRLVILASCQSAGSGRETHSSHERALSALGPRLAEVCIPAVVAMQGNIAMQAVSEFMPTFFRELQNHGQIDLAMAVARSKLLDKSLDWWRPALFMRLKGGRIWYTPGFAGDQQGLQRWPAILNHIEDKRCTPILGPGLSESLLGSHRDLARRWAETYHFPLAPYHREEFPHVAQYLAIYQDPTFLRASLRKYIGQELRQRYPETLDNIPNEAQLNELLKILGAKLRAENPNDPYRVLAELPFKVYINTNPGNLLAEALIAAGKKPRIEICQWNEDIEYPSVYEEEPDYQPDETQPLVYHLFGGFQDLESLVLTEDDYFNYLINVSSRLEKASSGSNDPKALSFAALNRALIQALLFLGFQIEDWNLRVMFRYIMSLPGGFRKKKRKASVAAQIDLEEGNVLEPEHARQYVEDYFQIADINIYWGKTEDFIQELQQHLKGGSS